MEYEFNDWENTPKPLTSADVIRGILFGIALVVFVGAMLVFAWTGITAP